MKNKVMRYESMLKNEGKLNSQFSKVKIYIAYAGYNRNQTHIDRPVFEKMLPSIFNIPVVGEWREDVENFGGHGGKLELSDRGVKYIETTKPYGLVPESSEIDWEMVRDKDNVEREYLTATAYLWTGRYPELEKVLKDGSNQSMEISILEGEKDESDGYYYIHKAEFSALCILGKDDEIEENDVEPCFEGASVTSDFTLDGDDDKAFKSEFSLMQSELANALAEQKSTKGETNNMPKLEQETPVIEGVFEAEVIVAEEETIVTEEIVEVEVEVEVEAEFATKPEDEDEKEKDDKPEVEDKPEGDKPAVDEDEEKKKKEKNSLDTELELSQAKVLELEAKLEAFELANYEVTISELTAKLEAYELAEVEAKKAQHATNVSELVNSYGADLDGEEINSFTQLGVTLSVEELEDKIDAYMYKRVKAAKNGSKKYKLNTNTQVVVTATPSAEEASKYGKYAPKQ